MRHVPTVLVLVFALLAVGWSCDEPTDDPVEATPAEVEVTAEPATAGGELAEGEGGRTINPARGEETLVEWQTLQVGFPTGGWEIQFGQGKCKPEPACQDLKAVKDDQEKALTSCNDVSELVTILDEGDQALALVRLFTDHQYVLEDEWCAEVEVAEDGTLQTQLPKDLEEPPTSGPVKVVDFEGGFRVERTLICRGEEKDRIVRTAETVFTAGNWTREEVEVLFEDEGLVPRLK